MHMLMSPIHFAGTSAAMAIVVHVGTRREIKFVMLIRKEISLSFFGRASPRIDRSTGASDKVSLSQEKYSGENRVRILEQYCEVGQGRRLPTAER